MGLESYSRATSPIRRYTDIITHFQLKAHLQKRELPFSFDQLSNILPHIHVLETEIKDLQQNSIRFWMLRYLTQEGPKMYLSIQRHNTYRQDIMA
jgi:exoribonuclease-2